MGEEWGARTPWQFFTDHTDPGIAAATAAGRKAEFGSHGWDEDDVPGRVLLGWAPDLVVDAGRIDVPPRSAVVLG
jgi:hypothetical protein